MTGKPANREDDLSKATEVASPARRTLGSKRSKSEGAEDVGESSRRREEEFRTWTLNRRGCPVMIPVLIRRWRDKFISSRGNEYFCEIDEEYLTDRFNLTGLNTEVPYYQYALDLITDVFDLDADDELREQIEKSARHLYGLVHARYIVTTRGLAKMVSFRQWDDEKLVAEQFFIAEQLDKYKKCDFGKCPRVMCEQHPLLPMGQHDLPNMSTVRLYCARCEDIYNPKSSRHCAIDGAYFGSSFHNILFQVYPTLAPEKSIQRYEPKIYGFRAHAVAALQRWQDRFREEQRARLREAGIETHFAEDTEDDDEREDEDEIDSRSDRFGADAASARMDMGN